MARSIDDHCTAVRCLLAQARPVSGTETTLPLARAAGRVLARDLTAPLDLPTATNSQMDGFAVRVADLPQDGTPVTLPVRGVRAAGAPSSSSAHEPATATAVMTGAVVPRGADAVIPVERVRPASFDAQSVTIPAETAAGIAVGTFVRPAGSDVARGQVALPAGTVLGAAATGACAALGLSPEAEVHVRRGPRVLVVSGGDEVVTAGQRLPEGAVYDVNGPLLRAWLTEAGAEEARHVRVDDTPARFVERLETAVQEYAPEMIVTSGGISAGAFEVVRQALDAHARMWFGHVAVQPGGPQGCGSYRGIPVVSLPGNPVSTWVSCEMFLRPALAHVWGTCPPPHWGWAETAEPVSRLPGRTQLRRGVADAVTGAVRCVGGASSHLLMSAARATVLIRVPDGDGELPAGTRVRVLHVAGGIVEPAGSQW